MTAAARRQLTVTARRQRGYSEETASEETARRQRGDSEETARDSDGDGDEAL